MRVHLACMLAAFGLTFLQGQDYELAPDTKTPAGLVLDEAMLLQDDQQKAVLLKTFVEKFPRHQGIAWAYNEIRQIALKNRDRQEVLRLSEKLVRLDPNDIYSGLLLLQTAEDLGARPIIEQWLEPLVRQAREVAAKGDLKAQLVHAGQLVKYRDYLAINGIMEDANARSRAAKLEQFVSKNPESPYAAQVLLRRFYAYWELLDLDRGLSAARDVLASDPDDEDALIYVAFASLEKPGMETDVLTNARRLLELLPIKKAPDQNNLAGWEKKKSVYTASAHWMIGMLSSRGNNHALAAVSFQSAMAGFSYDAKATAALLFFAGFSSYKVEQREAALDLFEKCAKIEGPYRDKASQNVLVLRSERRQILLTDIENERKQAEQQLMKSAAGMCNCPRGARRL